MNLALLLPAYLPDLYYLSCLLQADRIVMLDLASFTRKGKVHRGKIRTPDGFQWLNIPINTEDKAKPLKDVRMDHQIDWISKHLKALEYNYRNSIYFEFYEPEIRADLERAREFVHLSEFTSYFMNRLFLYLQLDINLEWASSLPDFDPNPDVFAISAGADRVFQEQDSQNYQWPSSLRIEPLFTHPIYPQHFGDFIPGMSLLDLLFQMGPSAYEITDQLAG
ncbi:MAG: WbqC family protein [Balneolales bacterium]